MDIGGRYGGSSAWLIVLALAILVLPSCGGDPSRPVGNRAPSIRIVRGPIVDDDTVTQFSEVLWFGWDSDGFIDHYEYAIDIPDSLSAEEVEAPDNPVFEWRPTLVTELQVLLETAVPETVQNTDGTTTISGLYFGNHSLAVRSVDNEGALSTPDRIEFTVTNLMPTTTLTTPLVTQYISVSSELFVSWTGRDRDSPTDDQRPAAYEYKLIPIPSVFASNDAQYAVDVSPGPLYPWTRVSGSVESARLQLETPASYWFVIRAIDVTGAVENRFSSGRNAFKMETSDRNFDRPRLAVNASAFGRHVFPDDGLAVSGQIYLDRCLTFEMSADLSLYGGVLQGYNIGVDVADTEDFSETSGYLGWTLIPRTIQPICFGVPGIHTITIVARDTGGKLAIAFYVVRVLALPRKDREVLIVDDFPLRSAGGLADVTMDAQSREMLLAAGYRESEIYTLDPWGPGDATASFKPLTREDIGRYRMLFWNVNGAGATGTGLTVLTSAANCGDQFLRDHLRSGGGLWFHGTQSIWATKRASAAGGCFATLGNNGEIGIFMLENDLLCRFMDLCGGNIRQVLDTSKKDGLIAALPTPIAAAELFPPLEVDSTRYNHAGLGGLRYVDAQFGPVYSENLEPLYTMVPVEARSFFVGREIAWRYADPDPAPQSGPVAAFAFPYHQMKTGSAAARTGVHGLARSMGDWFRSHVEITE